MCGPLIQQFHSLVITVPCAVVSASHLNCAFKQTFFVRHRLHYNLIKVCKKLQMLEHIFKRLTLAQCVDVQFRPTALRLSAYSAYVHSALAVQSLCT